LLDDIRYYLGLRFRQRLGEEDAFLEENLEEETEEEEESPDDFFQRQAKLQDELLGRIDELLGESTSLLRATDIDNAYRELEARCIDGILCSVDIRWVKLWKYIFRLDCLDAVISSFIVGTYL
jgi:hypothetical protein